MRLAEHIRRHFVGYLALSVALGGTSYAAIKLPKNSVGTKQLRNGAVTTKKIAAKTRQSLRGQSGPQGPPGAPGAPGSPGAAGAPGPGAVRFTFERTADPAPSTATYTLGSAYGVTITAPCVAASASQLSTTLELDPDTSGQLSSSYQRTWSPSGTSDSGAFSTNVLGTDPPTIFLGFALNGDDDGYAHGTAAFDNGTRTVLIDVYVWLDNSTDRCHAYGGIWPAT